MSWSYYIFYFEKISVVWEGLNRIKTNIMSVNTEMKTRRNEWLRFYEKPLRSFLYFSFNNAKRKCAKISRYQAIIRVITRIDSRKKRECFGPTEDAYSSGHLVLSHFGTCMYSNVETNVSWTCLVSGLLKFEHPSVLLFCFHVITRTFRNIKRFVAYLREYSPLSCQFVCVISGKYLYIIGRNLLIFESNCRLALQPVVSINSNLLLNVIWSV